MYLMNPDDCMCRACDGGHKVPEGHFGGSHCPCSCHTLNSDEREAFILEREAKLKSRGASAALALPDAAAVGGRHLECTIAMFEHRCQVYITMEQRKPLPDNGLIAVLCDAVRCAREYVDIVGEKVEPAAPDAGLGEPQAVQKLRDYVASLRREGMPQDSLTATLAYIDALASRLAEAERLIKNLAPTGRYNGLDIEEWHRRALAAESALAAEKQGRQDDMNEASIRVASALMEKHEWRSQAGEMRKALDELLSAELAEMPQFEKGKDAQDAWADRRATARNAARAALSRETGEK